MFRLFLILVLTLIFPISLFAMPFWGDKESRPVDTVLSTLKPGQFIWEGDAVPSGPIVVVVSLTEQRAYVYRNGIRIGVSSASTGKRGYDTPTGVFMILQKDKDHTSKKYNNAPMPYTERLTWDGVALHAGGLPGYPSSHGCVHLPSEFARLLFEVSPMGMTVVIADENSAPYDVAHPPALAPVDAKKGTVVEVPRLSPNEEYRGQPEKSTEGPISIVISGADQRVLVYRNGIEIGRAKVSIEQPEQPFGTHAYIMQEGLGTGSSPILKTAQAHRWITVGIPGYLGEARKPADVTKAERLRLPTGFAETLYGILTPGTTLFVTDAPILEQQTTAVALNVMNADHPADEVEQ
jgi:hypothetical protein